MTTLPENKGTKEKLWNANYNKVMFINFALFFSFYLLMPLLPIYLSENFNATKDTIGVVLSGYTLVALITRMFSGYIVDSFSRKKVLMACLFVYFLVFGGYLAAGSLVLFAIFRTLHGAPFGASTVANSTMAIDVLPASRRNEGIGLYGLSNNLGSALAPLAGIYIYDTFHDFDIIFWLAFIMAGMGFLATWTIKAPANAQEKNKQPLSLDRFFLSRGWYLALNMAFFGFCWGVLSNYLAIYGKECLGMTGGTANFFLILSAGLIISRLQGSKSLREGKLLPNAMEGIILSTVGYAIFIAWPSYIGYYGAAILIGFGNGHLWPAFQNMIIAVAHHNERGTANSTILTSWDLGLGLGILLGGVVAEHVSYSAAFWMNAAVQFAGCIVFFLLTKGMYSKMTEKEGDLIF
ncbi:MAG: MFS transporter [Bacteroidales bacterium]|nr:MFS transporter [Bacteroidales bacterium]